MNVNPDRTFRPRLESLEGRLAPVGIANLIRLPSGAIVPAVVPARSTAAAVATLMNPVRRTTITVSPVPTHINIGGAAQTSGIVVTTSAGGLTTPGLPTIATHAFDFGLTTPGLPSFPPFQLVTPTTGLPGGLQLRLNGSVSGSLFGIPPTLPAATAPALRGTAAAVQILTSPASSRVQSVSTVPTHISLGLFDMPSAVNLANRTDLGLTTPGLISPSILGNSAGLMIPGLPTSHTSG
jgi:hypothetical protein